MNSIFRYILISGHPVGFILFSLPCLCRYAHNSLYRQQCPPALMWFQSLALAFCSDFQMGAKSFLQNIKWFKAYSPEKCCLLELMDLLCLIRINCVSKNCPVMFQNELRNHNDSKKTSVRMIMKEWEDQTAYRNMG